MTDACPQAFPPDQQLLASRTIWPPTTVEKPI
eukprot:CAMPEP_0181492224 /NCGR_PEP_ID=MMETSP1110-20121109/50563_1 /TAXON_ID=174948 /ORGANISM="Symbiodinium sp., Strain CCMP421" /LENGTH=31 /DNA_ID= /DNA_START= /DNA_END= /DNA_ORIENTATION=